MLFRVQLRNTTGLTPRLECRLLKAGVRSKAPRPFAMRIRYTHEGARVTVTKPTKARTARSRTCLVTACIGSAGTTSPSSAGSRKEESAICASTRCPRPTTHVESRFQRPASVTPGGGPFNPRPRLGARRTTASFVRGCTCGMRASQAPLCGRGKTYLAVDDRGRQQTIPASNYIDRPGDDRVEGREDADAEEITRVCIKH